MGLEDDISNPSYYYCFFFLIGKLKTLFKIVKKEHRVKELTQESKDSLPSIQ